MTCILLGRFYFALKNVGESLTAVRSAIFSLGLLLVACMPSPPYRTDTALVSPANCQDAYERASWPLTTPADQHDQEMAILQHQIRTDLHNPVIARCWRSAWESHLNYELFSVEFDDQGWLADQVKDPATPTTQMSLLMERLTDMAGEARNDPQPLSLIIYIHGWHHSAEPYDTNVIAFRSLLERAAEVERKLCLERRGAESGLESAPKATCAIGENGVPPWQRKRRVVGIYIGWRGDSIEGPLLEDSSIWDRKLIAEKVALGSVQELVAKLHSFYLEHACHIEPKAPQLLKDPARCADTRMLTIGHSFGGLIAFRALHSRLMQGVTETTYLPGESPDGLNYAYSYGDLTVLINPAFEATRFEPLAQAATERQYADGISKDAQLPTLIVATSETDDATGIAFPIFRWLTTRFEESHGNEREANIETVGWNSRYQTHYLTLSTGHDACGLTPGATLDQILEAEAKHSDEWRRQRFVSFDASALALCDGLELQKMQNPSQDGMTRPPFYPLWVIKANRRVIDGHNDFLNPNFLNFVRQIYYTIMSEEDQVMRKGIVARSQADAAPQSTLKH